MPRLGCESDSVTSHAGYEQWIRSPPALPCHWPGSERRVGGPGLPWPRGHRDSAGCRSRGGTGSTVAVDTDRDSDSSRPAARAAAPGRSPGAYARVGSGGVARVGASERPAAAHRDSDLRRPVGGASPGPAPPAGGPPSRCSSTVLRGGGVGTVGEEPEPEARRTTIIDPEAEGARDGALAPEAGRSGPPQAADPR